MHVRRLNFETFMSEFRVDGMSRLSIVQLSCSCSAISFLRAACRNLS